MSDSTKKFIIDMKIAFDELIKKSDDTIRIGEEKLRKSLEILENSSELLSIQDDIKTIKSEIKEEQTTVNAELKRLLKMILDFFKSNETENEPEKCNGGRLRFF